MKYLTQILWILFFTFAGESLHALIDLPIPAAIYGLVLLLLALCLKLLRPEQLSGVGHLLIDIMPLLFICPAVGLMSSWPVVKENWLPICLIICASLLVCFLVSGLVTKLLMKKEAPHE